MLELYGTPLRSRLLLGTARYPSPAALTEAVRAARAEVVTVALRRESGGERRGEGFWSIIRGLDVRVLPNTAGCHSVKEAVTTAHMAREVFGTPWIKLEVIGDRELLYPDVEELLRATEALVTKGFVVLPYCNEDPVSCQKLADVGCAAVMPLGSLIGSGMGIANPAAIELICARSPVPVVLDAGIGTASDAAQAMELGCDAVMIDTAIAKSHDPVRMAAAMRAAIEGGRLARLAGRIPKQRFAEPSSPQLGLVGS
jgi:thiazole synthase